MQAGQEAASQLRAVSLWQACVLPARQTQLHQCAAPTQLPPSLPALSRLLSCLQLRHSEEGLASISLQGDEFCITLGRALMLDETHQVGCSGLLVVGLSGSGGNVHGSKCAQVAVLGCSVRVS